MKNASIKNRLYLLAGSIRLHVARRQAMIRLIAASTRVLQGVACYWDIHPAAFEVASHLILAIAHVLSDPQPDESPGTRTGTATSPYGARGVPCDDHDPHVDGKPDPPDAGPVPSTGPVEPHRDGDEESASGPDRVRPSFPHQG